MSVDKPLRGVSCVECRFCFFDESLESSFSDSEMGNFFLKLFGKSNQVAFRSSGKSTRVTWTGGSSAGAAPRTLCLCQYFVSSFFYYDSMNNVFLISFCFLKYYCVGFVSNKNVYYIVLDGWKYPVRYDWVNCWRRDSLMKVVCVQYGVLLFV